MGLPGGGHTKGKGTHKCHWAILQGPFSKTLLTTLQLVESNGMEVFSRYFRRLLVGNSPQIFPGINRNIENPGNYPLLVEEIEKVTRIPEQAQKIVETIETSDGDIFRDFDVSTFINHFQLDALAKTLLASAFTKATKADIRAKGIAS